MTRLRPQRRPFPVWAALILWALLGAAIGAPIGALATWWVTR